MSLEELVTQLRAAYGAGLRSVVLYGSAARGDHDAKRSDYNVLVIVDALDPSRLAAASAASRAWADAGNPAPMTMTLSEWRGSSDIFPMEYADILERHRVLYGDAPFEGIAVERRDLRLQLEQEAMGKLLKLRQGVLASGNDGGRQVELLAASASAIMIILRSVLRLCGRVAPTDNEAMAREAGQVAGFDADSFVRVVQHVRGASAIKAADAATVLSGYLGGMQRLVAFLDAYQPNS
jgi:hypothetical protein